MVRGSCLCDAVSFEFREVASSMRLCHCHRCQKISGSAFFAGFAVEGLSFLSGEGHIRSFEAPILKFPPAYRRDFCECCGSPVPWPGHEPGSFIVPAGSLDQDPGVRPSEHVLVECIAPWDEITDQLPQFSEAQIMYNWAREQEETGEHVVERYEFLLEHYADSDVVASVKKRLDALTNDAR